MNARRWLLAVAAVSACLITGLGFAWAAPGKAATAPAPENLARKAVVSADSQFSDVYAPKGAIDGKIPEPLSQTDTGMAWVVDGKTHNQAAEFTLEWLGPVKVAEVVYYGRTGWRLDECYKEVAVHVDGVAKPVCTAALQAGHGPQRVKLPAAVEATKLTLKFRGSHGGLNLGASEIQVYSTSPGEDVLGKFAAASNIGGQADKPRTADNPGKAGKGPAAVAAAPVQESAELAASLKAGKLGFSKMLVVQRNHIGCSHVYTYHAEGQRNGGGLYSYDLADGSLTKLLDSANGQILGYELSFDAKELLVSWRKTEAGQPNRYQVYRMDLDANGMRVSNIRQLTRGDHDNFDAVWLPDGDIAFLSTRTPLVAYCWTTLCGVMHRMKGDGSDVRRISANYLNDFTPSLLNDGRLIYGRWEYVDRPAIPIQGLWAINPDGTNLSGFYGNRVLDPATFIEARAVPDSHLVLCTLTGHNGTLRGAIGLIDVTFGDNEQQSIRNVTPEIRLAGVDKSTNGPRGPYQTPYPLDMQHYLVSHAGTILLRDYDAANQVTVLKDPAGLGFYNPQPLRARTRPPVRPSLLPEKAEPWATVVLQDVYIGLEPTIARGTVKRLCIVQEMPKPQVGQSIGFGFQRPVVSCGATYSPKKVWGFVNVNPDGSAAFRVPANQPIYFLPLDEKGRAVQRMRTFTHLMPGEVQGCVGCHTSRSSRSPDKPVQLTLASQKVQQPAPPEWGVRGFDFSNIVQPVLDRNCVKCHNAREHPNGIDLTGDRTEWFNVSYDVLAYEKSSFGGLGGVGWRSGSPYVSWISTMNGSEQNILHVDPLTWGSPVSKLADMVLAGHPDKDGKPRVDLSPDDKQRIVTWIDVNAPYYGTATTTHQNLPGGRALRNLELQKVLADVASRRCSECHKPTNSITSGGGHQSPKKTSAPVPVQRVRMTNPQENYFLLAPLAKSAGGTEKCGKAIFADTSDADYQKLLKTFEPLAEMLKKNPRQDMPGAVAAPCEAAACGKDGAPAACPK